MTIKSWTLDFSLQTSEKWHTANRNQTISLMDWPIVGLPVSRWRLESSHFCYWSPGSRAQFPWRGNCFGRQSLFWKAVLEGRVYGIGLRWSPSPSNPALPQISRYSLIWHWQPQLMEIKHKESPECIPEIFESQADIVTDLNFYLFLIENITI